MSQLVRAPTDHIEPNAFVTQGGERYSADVIVYAIGFYTSRALWPIQVVGHDDEGLQTLWGERPYALLGHGLSMRA
jgi:hypothetical protein